MSQKIGQPIGQKRLTNVALVKYKKHGKRFEIACYRNKVVNWRNGVEKDLDEVLQSMSVFFSVSKGVLAKKEDLELVFGTDDEEKVCLKILAEGEFQLSDKEREVELQNLFRDVASILAEKCVNPQSSKPYTITVLERALRDIHFSVDPKRSAKQQALAVLPQLQSRIPIERSQMRLRLTMPVAAAAETRGMLQQHEARIEAQELTHGDTQVTFVCCMDPGHYRQLDALVRDSAQQGARLDVVSHAAEGSSTSTSSSRDALGESSVPGPAPPASPSPAEDSKAAVPSSRSGFSQRAAAQPSSRPGPARGDADEDGPPGNVLYERGPISGIPEEYAARRDRFSELDELQPGWEVTLAGTGDGPIDATFFAPSGTKVGAYTNARRAALQASKSAT